MPIQGTCDSAFHIIKDVFANNFSNEDELGAACCFYIEGKKVVDLWGGYCDKYKTRPWQQDTLVGIYSVGKALAALCTLQLIDQNRLQLDSPVADVWPEFAQADKAQITLRQVLSHQAGLPAIRKRLPEDAMLNWAIMSEALAQQHPWFTPGSKAVYHTNTYGYLIGEPVRRITGLSVGEYFQRHIAGPLHEEVYFGAPTETLPRIADINWHPSGDAPPSDILDKPMNETERMVQHSYFNPSGFSSLGVMNTTPWRQAEVPSTNGIGTARGIANIYHILAEGGRYGGVQLLSEPLLKEASQSQVENRCPILERPVSFGLGFQPTREYRKFGPSPNSFGHFGSGGSLGFADPDLKLGFGYVMNDVVPRWQNTRNQALIDALYQCL